MRVSLWCLCSVLISMLYPKGLIYHVYLIYMSMSFMSSLINVKFLGVFSGTGINQSFILSPGHSSLHHRVALLPVQCNLTWVKKSVESVSGKQINLRSKRSSNPWGFNIFHHSHITQYNKATKTKVNKRSNSVPSPQGQPRLLKPVWWCLYSEVAYFSYLPVFNSSPNLFWSPVT